MGLLWMDHQMALPLHLAYWVKYAVFRVWFVTCGAHCSNKPLCHEQCLVFGCEHQRLRCDEVSSIHQVGPLHCSVSSKWDSNCNVCSWVAWTLIHFIVVGCWHVYRTFRWWCAFTTSSYHFFVLPLVLSGKHLESPAAGSTPCPRPLVRWACLLYFWVAVPDGFFHDMDGWWCFCCP